MTEETKVIDTPEKEMAGSTAEQASAAVGDTGGSQASSAASEELTSKLSKVVDLLEAQQEIVKAKDVEIVDQAAQIKALEDKIAGLEKSVEQVAPQKFTAEVKHVYDFSKPKEKLMEGEAGEQMREGFDVIERFRRLFPAA